MDELIKQAEALGIKVDKRWKEDRLREEIEKALAEEPAGQTVSVAIEAAPGSSLGAVSENLVKVVAPAKPRSGVTIKNMTPNRNKRLGIDPHGTLTLTSEQLSDRQFMARIDHGVETGVLGIV